MHSTVFAMRVGAAKLAGPAMAGNRAQHSHAGAELASMQLEHDSFAPVYIVTRRKTFDGINRIARNGVARRDSTGAALVVSEIKAHQLSEASEHIHPLELRCGGYFAFRNRKDADAFIPSGRR